MIAGQAIEQKEYASAITHLDLGGDVNLLGGPRGCQIRLHVLKALLSLVSHYFRALFGAKPCEGNATEIGEDIHLNEDEPDAIVNLCKILHRRYTLPTLMAPFALLQLAIVADKYSCLQAVRMSLDALFPKQISWDRRSMLELIMASYVLDHAQLYYQYSQSFMMDHPQPLASLLYDEAANRVPIAAWCKYNHVRLTCLSS